MKTEPHQTEVVVAVEYINLTQLSHHISHLSQLADRKRTRIARVQNDAHAYKTTRTRTKLRVDELVELAGTKSMVTSVCHLGNARWTE